MTSEPVELMCMSCAMSRLFVLMYSQEIRTRINSHGGHGESEGHEKWASMRGGAWRFRGN